MADERDVINSLLTKLGVDEPEKLIGDRANTKLGHRLTTKGAPAGMTEEETALVVSLGFDPTPKEGAEDTAKPAKKKKGKSAKVKQIEHAEAEGAAAARSIVASDRKKAKGKKTGKGKKAAKSAKPASTGKALKPKGERPADVFRAAFANKKAKIAKSELVTLLTDAGASPGTANSYIVWAKREQMGKPDHANPWGFQIKEAPKNDAGEKILSRV